MAELATTIADHDGSWLESRMAHLAGHFAGLLHIECPEDKGEGLVKALQGLDRLSVHVAGQLRDRDEAKKTLHFDVVGNDRPGIIQQLSSAIVSAGGNVEELSSNLESAPHAGHPVFHATGTVAVGKDFAEATLL
ncbi:MAG: hypothetical protein GWM88_14380, partial [Pseudomonadales bacterium]|nr:hypothetical protein [Pseudomonadales bacterium]NIX09126.1 hypothetical protein [Pseudomonadales bacterium]